MKAVGIILSNIHDKDIPELTSIRSIASVPFGGRYRLIDFALSNMVNSGITTVGIVTKSNYQSLMDHVGSGKEWRGVRDKRFTYAVYRKDRAEYLFDNFEDPLQKHNLAHEPRFKGEKERLKAAMYAKMKEIGDEFDDNLHYMGRWVKKRRIVRTATLK